MTRAKAPAVSYGAEPRAVEGGSGNPGRANVTGFYRLLLRRDPESEEAFAVYQGAGCPELLAVFANSPEFIAHVVEPLERGENPWVFGEQPSRELNDWMVTALPLTPSGVRAVRKSGGSWPALFLALVNDADFRQVAGPIRLFAAPVVESLRLFSVVAGDIERADSSVVSGWVRSPDVDAAPLGVELWIDGAFAAATVADRFRRDVQDGIGGDGQVGFVFHIPPRPVSVTDALIEVRTAGEGVVLGTRRVSLAGPRPDALAACRAEIAQLKAMVERLEQALPAAVTAVGGATPGQWAAYHDAWYAGLEAERPAEGSWAVIVDGAGADPVALQASIAAVVDQAVAGDRLFLIAGRGQTALADDLVRRARALGLAGAERVRTRATDPAERAAAALARAGGRALTLLLQAGDVPAPAALALLTQRFHARRAAHAIYVDEDGLEPDSLFEGPEARHARPLLKPGPDVDLLLQTPYVGRTVAFRTQSLSRLDLAPGRAGWHAADAVLRLMSTPRAVDHLARVLVTRTGPDPDPAGQVAGWSAAVAAHLAAREDPASLGPHEDLIGAVQPGALRIRRPVPPGVRATVIIATRDRLDLLRPCIESLDAHRAANVTAMDLCVVDHESAEPATLAYLDRLRAGGVDVLRHTGPFNWALMNNIAAARAKGDVLVFLNNDTVALSPDWLDELVGQALRPEVGVVGCRLLYPDGTLQHAGFVTHDVEAGWAAHEGVGVPGSDGGYLGRHALTRAVPAVTGACMAVARETFQALGGFDAAALPVEYNDVELCLRARSRGLKVLYAPAATLYHLESKSRGLNTTPEKAAAGRRASRLTWARWGERMGPDAGFNPHFARTGTPFGALRPPSW